MSTGAYEKDPLVDAPALPEDGASKEQVAVAAYDAVATMLAALRVAADETAAKNFVAITIKGFKAPFERMDIALVRPGGLPPSQVAQEAVADKKYLLDLLHCAYAALIDGRNTAMVCREIDEVLRENGVLK